MKKKGERSAGGRKTGGTGRGAAQTGPPPRQRPGWDSTTSDMSRFRLSPAQQEFRISLRQRQPAPFSSGRQELPREPAADDGAPQLAVPRADALLRSASFFPHQAALHAGKETRAAVADDCPEEGRERSLEEMRRFVAEIQLKYPVPSSGADAPHNAPALGTPCASLAHQKLAQLQSEMRAAAAREEEAGSSSDGAQPGEAEAAAQPACEPQDSESEGEGRLGPAALRRAQRRLLLAPLPPAPPASASEATDAPKDAAQQSMLDRLVALEARLGQFEEMEGALRQAQAAVAELQDQTVALRTGAAGAALLVGTLCDEPPDRHSLKHPFVQPPRPHLRRWQPAALPPSACRA